jgi:hypothetical protein
MTLQGGLGPALLPATLADKPAERLVATIIGGRTGHADAALAPLPRRGGGAMDRRPPDVGVSE